MKKNIKLISNVASVIILSITLLISVSYAWYTNNKNVNSSGIGSVASDSITILKQGIFKQYIDDNPFPETDKKNEVEGVLSGDVIYYSVAIALSNSNNNHFNYDLNISVVNIDGGDYFVKPAIEVFSNPNGTKTDRTYTFNEEVYDIYLDENNDEYFAVIENEDTYIYYLYESTTGEILTKKPKLVFANPNGESTGKTIYFDGSPYLTHLDSNGKEYFITYDTSKVNGVDHINATYVNYIYETMDNENPIRYNMCDVYTIGIFKVFGVDSNNEYVVLEDYSNDLNMLKMEKENGLDKDVSFFNLYDYEKWDTSTYEEIVFTFAIKFDYSEFEEVINTNCVSNKELIFTSVLIKAVESEETE